MSNLDLGRRHDLARLEEAGPRVCLTPDCGTILSRHNSAQRCAVCSNRVEIGGAVIRRDPPMIVGSRPPPPDRPVLEGAVPLPGVVRPKRERSYAEMIAKTTPGAKAEETLPGDTSSDEIEEVEERAVPPEPEPDVEPAVSETEPPPEPPKTAKPRARKHVSSGRPIGAPRKFDWHAAAQLYLEVGNFAEVARSVGVTDKNVRKAVRSILTPEQITAAAQTPPKASHRRAVALAIAESVVIADAPPPAPHTRAGILARLTEIGLELDAIDAQRWTLNDQASRILEEWGELLRVLARYDGDAR